MHLWLFWLEDLLSVYYLLLDVELFIFILRRYGMTLSSIHRTIRREKQFSLVRYTNCNLTYLEWDLDKIFWAILMWRCWVEKTFGWRWKNVMQNSWVHCCFIQTQIERIRWCGALLQSLLDLQFEPLDSDEWNENRLFDLRGKFIGLYVERLWRYRFEEDGTNWV